VTRSGFVFAWFSLIACSSALPERDSLEVGFSVLDRVLYVEREEISLAVGTEADLAVVEPRELVGGSSIVGPDDLRAATITRAVSEQPNVIRVSDVRGSFVHVEAVSAGTSRVLFETSLGNRTFTVNAGHPSEVRLAHVLWGEGRAPVFVVGGTARFRMTRRDSAGRLLGGSGPEIPVHADPPHNARFTMREGDAEFVDVRFDRSGAVTLRPVGGPELTVDVIEEEEVAVIRVAGFDPSEPLAEHDVREIAGGGEALLSMHLERQDGARILGLVGAAGIDSLTPEVCECENADRLYGDAVFTLRARTAGTCRLRASFRELSTELEVAVGS
jgi:hypothetical protein